MGQGGCFLGLRVETLKKHLQGGVGALQRSVSGGGVGRRPLHLLPRGRQLVLRLCGRRLCVSDQPAKRGRFWTMERVLFAARDRRPTAGQQMEVGTHVCSCVTASPASQTAGLQANQDKAHG